MFKTPTMEHSTLHKEDTLQEGYQPKMLLYTRDKLFYIFDQVKQQQGTDEKPLCTAMHQAVAWVQKEGHT